MRSVRVQRLAVLAAALVALLATIARAVEILDLHAAGDDGGEYLAVVEYRDGGERYDSTTIGRVFRRQAVDPLDDWQVVARYPRRIVALAVTGDGTLAVLLRRSGDESQTQLRLVRPPAAGEPASLGGPTETFPPTPPDGRQWRDVVATRDNVLHALADDGSLWRLDGQQWTRVATAPDGYAGDGDLVATADGLLLVTRGEEATNVHRLDGETFVPMDLDLPPGVVVADDAGRPPLFYLPADDDAGTLRQGDREQALTWRPPEGTTIDATFPVMTTAAGATRLTRLATAEDGEPILLRRTADAATLVAGDGEAAVLDLRGSITPGASGVMRLILYAALVFAVVAMLRQGHRAGEARRAADGSADEAIAAPVAAPMSLRLAAAGVDLLPLLFTIGLLTSEPVAAAGTVAIVVALVGLLAYVALPLVGELVAGRSPGKALFGLRVVAARDVVPPTGASTIGVIVRNVVRPVDLAGGWATMLFDPTRRRLGDFAAGTRVIYDPVRPAIPTTAGPD